MFILIIVIVIVIVTNIPQCCYPFFCGTKIITTTTGGLPT
jgi:hypothetical protein